MMPIKSSQTEHGVHVILAAPIQGAGGKRIGTDIIILAAEPVAIRLAQSKRKAGGSTRIFLLHNVDGEPRLMLADRSIEALAARPRLPSAKILAAHIQDGISLIFQDDLIAAVAPVGANGWSVVVKREGKEVFAGLNRDLSLVGLAVLGMTLVGAAGVYLLLKPVTGTLLVHADSLRHAVDEATAEAEAARLNAEDAQRRAEVALENLQRTQESLVQSEKMASLGGLVAGIAHEINTPVGIVVTSASFLTGETDKLKRLYQADDLSAHELEEFLTTAGEAAGLIQSNALRAADLIQSFKQVAVDQTAGERRVIDLKAYVGEVLTSLTPKLKKRLVKVEVDMPVGIEIDTFPGALSQVLTNLIVNSLMHGFEGDREGAIRIAARLHGDQVELRYADDGKGIPPENCKKVFDPFFTTRRNSGGSGLGLNILYNVVTRTLGGSVTLDESAPKGVAFVIRFPRNAAIGNS